MKKKMDAKKAMMDAPVEEGTVEEMQEQSIGSLFNVDEATERQLEADGERFTAKGMKLIHSPQSRSAVVNVLNKNNPIESVADATVQVISRLDQVSDGRVNDMVKIKSGLDLMMQIIEVGEASGKLQPMSDEEKQAAYAVSIEKYLKGEIAAGRINKEALTADMEQGIAKMSGEERMGLGEQLQTINRTAVGSTMETAGQATDSPMLAAKGAAVQESVEGNTMGVLG